VQCEGLCRPFHDLGQAQWKRGRWFGAVNFGQVMNACHEAADTPRRSWAAIAMAAGVAAIVLGGAWGLYRPKQVDRSSDGHRRAGRSDLA